MHLHNIPSTQVFMLVRSSHSHHKIPTRNLFIPTIRGIFLCVIRVDGCGQCTYGHILSSLFSTLDVSTNIHNLPSTDQFGPNCVVNRHQVFATKILTDWSFKWHHHRLPSCLEVIELAYPTCIFLLLRDGGDISRVVVSLDFQRI